MIRLQHITKTYGSHTAVNKLSLQVNQGETVVLLGPSGCGKTTTLRMINRLTEPTSGSIFIQEKNILHQPAELLRRNIGYVLQHTGLFPHYTIEENIATVPQLLKWTSTKIKKRVHALLEKLHLPPAQFAHKYPHQLSGGQQQRVGLARALAADPPILLMDEPFGALDPITRSSVRNEFIQLDELKQKTIVLVTHDVQEAFALADRICLLQNGNLVQMDSPAALLFKPSHPFVRDFFKENHLLLQLQSLTLEDIWYELHDTGKTFTTKEIPLQQDVWSTLQLLSSQHDSTSNFFVQKDGVIKCLHTTSVMAAFQQYQTMQHHE